MALQRFIVIAALLSWGLEVLAYPQAKDLGPVQKTYIRAVSDVIQHVSVPGNSTNAPPLPPAPIGHIECFIPAQGRKTTDIIGCRPTLRYFRGFPDYRKIQDFMEGRYPKNPSKPPYAVHHIHSNCAIRIAAVNPTIIDDFSFEQARALAIEILDVCQDHGGRGGVAPIGHGVGWSVSVIGWTLPPDPPDRPGLSEEGDIGNGTSVPIMVVEA